MPTHDVSTDAPVNPAPLLTATQLAVPTAPSNTTVDNLYDAPGSIYVTGYLKLKKDGSGGHSKPILDLDTFADMKEHFVFLKLEQFMVTLVTEGGAKATCVAALSREAKTAPTSKASVLSMSAGLAVSVLRSSDLVATPPVAFLKVPQGSSAQVKPTPFHGTIPNITLGGFASEDDVAQVNFTVVFSLRGPIYITGKAF